VHLELAARLREHDPGAREAHAAYLNSALARDEAKVNGYDEAILLTQDGYVAEASAEHVFIVRGGALVTPTTQEDNLEGITRRVICELVRNEMGREVVERRVSRTELYTADEAFLCGTGAEVTRWSKWTGARSATAGPARSRRSFKASS